MNLDITARSMLHAAAAEMRRLGSPVVADDLTNFALKLGAYKPKPTAPQLTVHYGSLPESNGKHNYTATLMRKGQSLLDGLTDGYTFARSEYPDRIRYEADSMRYLIGELEKKPFILDYDADKHSGYKESPEVVTDSGTNIVDRMTQLLKASKGYGGTRITDKEIAEVLVALHNKVQPTNTAAVVQGDDVQIVTELNAKDYMEKFLWQFIDIAAAFPAISPDSRIWGHVSVYASQPNSGRDAALDWKLHAAGKST